MEHIDIADLRRKVMAARTVTHELEPGVTVSFVLPTQHEIRVETAVARLATDPNEKAALERVKRALLVRGIREWSGVMVSHVAPGHEPDEPLDFDREAVELLFGVREDWADLLEIELLVRLADRRSAQETSEKN